MAAADPVRPRVGAEALHRFVSCVLRTFDVPADDAGATVDVLVAAHLCGLDSHGTARLHYYAHKLEAGLINRKPSVRITAESPAGCVIDGDNGLGQVASLFAMDHCIARAREQGGACAAVGRSNHFGVAGYYALRAVPHGMIGISMTNASPRN